MKRLVSLLLVLALALSGMMTAAAAENEEQSEEVIISVQDEDTEDVVEKETADKAEEEAEKQTEEETVKQAEEETANQAEEKAEDKAEEKTEDKAEEKTEDKAEEIVAEKSEDAAEKAEEAEQQTGEKSEEETAEESEGTVVEKEEIPADRNMKVGDKATCDLSAGKPYLIRLQGISGDVCIEAEADFILKMTIKDETDERTQTVSGKEDEPFAAVLAAKSGRTYLISVTAKDEKSEGVFQIRISRQEKEEKSTEQKSGEEGIPEEITEEESNEKGRLASNDGSGETLSALSTPKIKKLKQNNTNVTITWSAVNGAKKYRVYAQKGSGDWTWLGTVTGTSYIHKCKVTRTTCGYHIRYKVRAVGEGNKLSACSPVKKILRLASPGTVTLKKNASTEDVVMVYWDAVKGAKSYEIHYRLSGAAEYDVKYVAGSKTKAIIPVTGTKQHDVYVVAAGESTKGQRSKIKSITPYWYRVLLVGEYDYPGTIDDLPGNKFDVSGMATLFKKQTSNVKTLYNASASTIYSNIASVFGNASPNTVCVFMYSGHGDTSRSTYSGTLVCSDDSYITPYSLKTYMDYYGSNHNVILLSSCGSGGFIDPNGEKEANFSPTEFNSGFINAFSTPASNAGEFAKVKHYTVITAAAAHQESWCWWWTSRKTGAVVNGGTELMRALARAGGYDYCNDKGEKVGTVSKKGDKNGDKKVTVKEAYNYAKKNVSGSSVQYWSDIGSLILFQ